MYETRTERLLSRRAFFNRFAKHTAMASAVLVFSLVVGTVGFHYLALQDWIDAFLDASMLLGGMGPVGEIQGVGGKLFASFYALYAGIVFIGVSALLLAPILHRILHRLHLEERRRSS